MTSLRSELVEVTLAQFAAIGGMTEHEYLMTLKSRLEEGRMMDVLRPEAVEDLSVWASTQDKFSVLFRLSLNRMQDSALTCLVRRIEGRLEVTEMTMGLCGEEPEERPGIETFEFCFCDMNNRI